MRINNIQNTKHLENRDVDKADKSDKVKPITREDVKPGAIFEKSKPEDKGHVYDKSTIEKLKKDSERSYDSLKKMVENLLRRQGTALNLLGPKDLVEVDEATRAEAGELISSKGPLGVEAVSDSIVDFAIAVSGGDKSKLDTLRNAIDKGFREAERILGGLPKISTDTYDRIMEKLDTWEKE